MREAIRPIALDYREDVRGMAQDAIDESTDEESMSEYIHESVDGSWWITYTWPSQFVLLISDNQDAYTDAFGATGAVADGAVNWAALAYCAMRQDVEESARAILDTERKCEECGDYVFGAWPRFADKRLRDLCPDCENDECDGEDV